MWPHLWVRSAGFPIDLILDFAIPSLIETVHELDDAKRALEAAKETSLSALRPLLDDSTSEKAASKAIRKIRKGGIPSESDTLAQARAQLADLRASDERKRRAEQALEDAYTASEAETARALSEVAALPLLEEAMTWQNPKAAEIVLPRVRDASRKLNSMQRQRLLAVASYLQRYCTKNDTIGFFGPISWAGIVEGEGTQTHGDSLLAHREVFFAGWAIEALAACVSQERDLKPFLKPRRMPTISVQDDCILSGTEHSSEAPDEILWLLSSATGERTANELAQEAVAAPELDFDDASEVFALLEELEEQELVVWQLQVAPIDPYPEESLRKQLLENGAPANEALAALSELTELRDKLAACASEPRETAHALRAMNEAFERIVGTSANRNAGQTYGARTIVFEDCARDLKLDVPKKVIERIGPALSTLLQSSRWSSWEVAHRYRERFDQSFDELGGERVRYTAFLSAINEYLPKDGADAESTIIGEVVADLRAKWTDLLIPNDMEDGIRTIQLHSEDIAQLSAEAFAAPCPGWPAAQYAGPDIMVASKDLLTDEEPTFVLGEFNPAGNYVFSNAITPPFCPIADDARARFASLIASQPQTVYRDGGRAMNRMSVTPGDVSIESGLAIAENGRETALAIADLYVERVDGRLFVVDPPSGRRYDIIAFHGGLFWESLCPMFGFLQKRQHTPRVTLDNVVVAREAWWFKADSLSFHTEQKRHARFAGAVAWRERNGLPRFIFARLNHERKPVFVDMESPILVESFCTILKGATDVKVTEMLPAPEECWLTQDGKRFTSELRTVIVDETAWSPES